MTRPGPLFALVAGELSGDLLGAAVIVALKARHPRARFIGVAGPRMCDAGCEAIAHIDLLSVMGIAEVLPALPRLLRLRAQLLADFSRDRPDVVIGIDAPDFNLGLERRLRESGLRTVHVVSPTVWAWRRGRVKNIVRSVDRLLCLFPFEPAFFEQAMREQSLDAARVSPQSPVFRAEYIGHPLADELDDTVTLEQARASLRLPLQGPVIAVLPGSRHSELRYLSEPFVLAAVWLARRVPGLRLITPIAKPGLRAQFAETLARHAPQLDWILLDGRSRDAMQTADLVLLASGTATLECLLLGRPMVVAYRGAALSAWLMLQAGLLKVAHVSLANLLSREPCVPEFLQDAATPERLGASLLALLHDPAARAAQLAQFDAIRAQLRRGAAERAAESIDRLLMLAAD